MGLNERALAIAASLMFLYGLIILIIGFVKTSSDSKTDNEDILLSTSSDRKAGGAEDSFGYSAVSIRG